MKTVLFISRKQDARHGGMQFHDRTLLAALSRTENVRILPVLHTRGSALLPWFCIRALLAILTTSADTVHVADAALTPLLAFVSFVRPRARRTVTVHGLDLSWRVPMYRLLLRHCLQFAHCVVAVSHATRDLALEHGASKDRLVVIPCAMTLPPDPPPRAPSCTILCLGRLVARKGTLWFLQHVFPLLKTADASLSLVIAGDGPQMPVIRDALSRHAYASSIRLAGSVDETEKASLLSSSAVLVMPNLELPDDPEGFGIVCLEAASYGLPTAAARIQGLQDAVIPGVTGEFFRSGNPEDAASVILHVLRKRFDPDAMRHQLADRFDPVITANRYAHDVF